MVNLSSGTTVMARPNVPADLRRRVLLESGHRCAIPTCQYPDVDVHHITSWADSQEHIFDNLIALCPNCHRRADRGEIDRKSLLIYKSRLTSMFGPELLRSSDPSQDTPIWIKSVTEGYDTGLAEMNDEGQNYNLNLEFPEFEDQTLSRVNEHISLLIKGWSEETRNASISPNRMTSLPYNVTGSYHVTLKNLDFVSVRFKLSNYTGGAHSNYWTEVINFRIDTQSLFGVKEIFEVTDVGLKAMSDYCIRNLTEYFDDESMKSFIERGAAADAKNFSSLNFAPEGIAIVFDPYQVGSFAQGSQEVIIPWQHLMPLLKADLIGVFQKHSETSE